LWFRILSSAACGSDNGVLVVVRPHQITITVLKIGTFCFVVDPESQGSVTMAPDLLRVENYFILNVTLIEKAD
jgi:hypothetical protein